MKKLQESLLSLVTLLKGKKKMVIVVSLVVIGVCVLGVKEGWISEDVLNFGAIVEAVDGMFSSSSADTLAPAVDTLSSAVVDTTAVVVDTLSK